MPKKILIADDSLFMRTVLKDILKDEYAIVEADSGSTAEKQIRAERPDLVLLDIIMPEGEEEGMSVLKKAMKANPKQKIVMISALGQDSIMAECTKLGAAGYVVKPFEKEEVLRVVKKILY
jgi:two-component system chemotaxis response regulator CheY